MSDRWSDTPAPRIVGDAMPRTIRDHLADHLARDVHNGIDWVARKVLLAVLDKEKP